MVKGTSAALAVYALAAVAPVWASTWTALTPASPDYGGTSAGGPDITVSPLAGNVYLACENVWNPGNANDRIINFCRGVRNGRSIDWSGTRSSAVEVCPRGTKPGAPSIAVSTLNGQEQIHIVYWNHLGTENLMYVRSVDGGNTWSSPVAVTSGGTTNPVSAMTGDNQGNVYLFYSDWVGNANANNLDIWFRKGTYNGTTTVWNAAYKIESDPSTKSERPRVFRDSTGKIHVAWSDRLVTPPRASYAVSTNNGASFSPPETAFLAEIGDDMKPAAVAADSGGTVYVAAHSVLYSQCCEPSRIDLATRTGTTWSPKVLLINNPATNPFLTADKLGNVFISWLRLPNSGAGDIYYMSHNSLGWSCPSNATQDGFWKGYDGGPHTVDAANGFIHIATDDTPAGYHRVYVTTLDLQSPPLPVTQFTAGRGNAQAALNWVTPNDPSITAIRLVHRTDRYPVSPTDGTLVEHKGQCNASDGMVLTGLTNYATYYFAVYTRSPWNAYSEPVLTSTVVAPRILADMDDDFDVDQADFGRFQVCMTGQFVPQNETACSRALLDNDEDVDQGDVTVLVGCLTGQSIRQAKPECLR